MLKNRGGGGDNTVGGTGIAELGVTIGPKASNAPCLDISLQSFAGKCEGIAGNIEATWKF